MQGAGFGEDGKKRRSFTTGDAEVETSSTEARINDSDHSEAGLKGAARLYLGRSRRQQGIRVKELPPRAQSSTDEFRGRPDVSAA